MALRKQCLLASQASCADAGWSRVVYDNPVALVNVSDSVGKVRGVSELEPKDRGLPSAVYRERHAMAQLSLYPFRFGRGVVVGPFESKPF